MNEIIGKIDPRKNFTEHAVGQMICSDRHIVWYKVNLNTTI